MRSKLGLNRISGRTAVAMMVLFAIVLLVVVARWTTGAAWPQMLADLVH